MDPANLLDRAARGQRARQLRRDVSKNEWRLWYRLCNRQLQGQRFRRQVPIGPYFPDLACLEARLVLEVDGEHHGDQLAYDRRRDRWLGEMGYRVLGFWVAEIDDNLSGVVETISGTLRPPTLPSPRRRGEE
jgi:very-short-patch-repair endonuclease